ncbi:MAG TPA: hypothetical protein VJ508_20730, partial [Saprospiraceae bacterium]|nr:hypothetical protein [Saprospiraceae bacterium]
LFFILVAVLFLAACNSSSDELASPASSPIGLRSPQTRAFHGNLSGAMNLNSAPTACTGVIPLALVDYFMSGNATHLGVLNNQSFLHHDNCDVNLETMILAISVSGQLVGANGDLITYTGADEVNIFNLVTGSGPNGPITGTWTITGGTGKFAGATGSFTISGLVDFTTLSFSVVADGTITY